jgi:YaiO family outer membrane protein
VPIIAMWICVATGGAWGQVNPAQTPAGAPRPSDIQPFRLELGGYYSWVDRGFGDWRGFNGEFWYRGNAKFVPGFFIDSQTRPGGTQQNYAFTSYLNWSPSFYTVQSVSGAPQRSENAIYFPEIRFDVKGFWKLPPGRKLVIGAGFTHFDFGRPGSGDIYNIGALYYRGKLVVEGNLFVNESRPGDLWSASGNLAVQYGVEGNYWLGVSAGGGRELYRYEGLTPVDVRLKSYSMDLFYRRWISRHVGYVIGMAYQDKLDAYRRVGGYARLFFDF